MRAVLAQCLEEHKGTGPAPLVYKEENGVSWTLVPGVAAFAGTYDGNPFDGADRISYSGALDALRFWRAKLDHVPLTFLDGDRFSDTRGWEFVQAYDPWCVFLGTDPVTLAKNTEARERVTGKVQNPTWVKGRITKCQNFAARFRPERLLRLIPWDAKSTAANLLQVLRTQTVVT